MTFQRDGWTSAGSLNRPFPLTATSHTAENRKRIYKTLCRTLAGQLDRMSWPAFSLADWDRLIATARAEGVAPLLPAPAQVYHVLEGGRGKVERGKAWAIACPSPAYMRWRYGPRPVLSHVEGPAWLWPLTYPYRWLDILRDGLSISPSFT